MAKNRVYEKFKTHLADQFFESYTEPANTSYYIVLSKSSEWPDDNNPPEPDSTQNFADHTFYDEMIGGKLVRPNDVSFVINRYNWVSGEVYAEYDHQDPDLHTKRFYVITDELNVYKCLFNNNGGASTDRPSGYSLSTFSTTDGYIWKYMYSVNNDRAEKFLTRDHIPVSHLKSDDNSRQWDVQLDAVNGEINAIKVTNAGSDYRAYTSGIVQSIVNSSAVVLATTANTSQDDHYRNSAFYVSSGSGAGQISPIIKYDAASRTLTVNDSITSTMSSGGIAPSTYYIGPQVHITSPDGSGATAIANINASSNTVANVSVINPGTNYRRANVEIIAKTEHGSGAIARGLISPAGGHGNNAVRELMSEKIMLSTTFSGDEGGKIPDSATFRQIILLKGPLLADGTQTNTVSTSVVRLCHQLTHTESGSSKFQVGEFVAGQTSKAEGRVIQSNTSTVFVSAVQGEYLGNEILIGNTTSTFTPSITALGNRGSDLINSSGELFYVQNLIPVHRTDNQIEDIKIVLDF